VPGSLVGDFVAMTEITDFAAVFLLVSAAVALAVASTTLTGRVPLPAPAIFLLAAAAASDTWPQLYEHVPILTVERIAVVALIVILFNGGMDIGWSRLRAAAGPILSLGVLGTFATAGLVAVFAHVALGFGWTLAGIIGAAVAPTDPAVMFSVLGRREIAGRSGTTLEGEAGVNDPAGIALMLGLIELATHDDASFLVVVREFAVEMAVGAAIGLVGGRILLQVLRRIPLPAEGLYPVLALALAGVLYATAAVAKGSGFLAVFVAGLVLGEARLPYKREIERFHTSLASLAEIVVFIALGLTVSLGGLSGRTWRDGVLLLLVLALVARPLVVALGLLATRLRWTERAFIAWSGLKGAVPILLAAFAVIAGVPEAGTVYGIVFVVVLLSVAVQGTLVPFVAEALHVPMHDRPLRPWQLSVGLGREPEGVHEFTVVLGARADEAELRHLPLGRNAWVTLVVRDGAAVAPRGSLRLLAGDRVVLLAEPEDGPVLRRLFS
jgi:potassium/hydrogen antiporter